MQQRRVRLGDILDDYCPRERRVTNHAVVAMVEEDVKRTRCTTCDTEHEYKQAKVPVTRRKKPVAAVAASLAPADVPSLVVSDEDVDEVLVSEADTIETSAEAPLVESSVTIDASGDESPALDEPDDLGPQPEDEWVHRPLIRATLPRPEGQTPERKPTDFTMRQTSGRFDEQRNGNRPRGNKPRQAHGQPSNPSRFGNTRPDSGYGRQGGGGGQRDGNAQRPGNRPAASGQRSGRPGQGGNRPPGQGRGPRRGR